MNFHKLAIGAAFTLASIATIQPATHASSRYDAIVKQLGLQTTPAQTLVAQAPDTLSSGHNFFSHAPQLIRTATSEKGGNAPATYEFTVTVPANAGQPLKAITIAQGTNLETVQFDLNGSQASLGKGLTAAIIPLAHIGGTATPGEVTVVFDQPVQPGNTVTVAIAAQANPNFGGNYEFGVTAYPVGDNSTGLFLGYGRINFYGNSN